MPNIDDYIPVVGQSVVDDLRLIAQKLAGKRILHVNSTAVGGGVAEILNRMVPLLRELEVDTHWDVIKGGEKFFEVTKKFHNALHGKAEEIGPDDFSVFLETSEMNNRSLELSGDILL